MIEGQIKHLTQICMWQKVIPKRHFSLFYSILFCLLFGADINYPAWLVVCACVSE